MVVDLHKFNLVNCQLDFPFVVLKKFVARSLAV